MRSAWCALRVLGAAAACGGGGRAAAPPVEPPAGLGGELVFTGACDVSGAVAVTGSLIVVADDEDNALRIYDTAAPGRPIEMVETDSMMGDGSRKHPEMDLEAAARIGDRVYWLASHGRKKSGKRAASRLRLFATDILPDGKLAFVGRPYLQLVDDLAALPGLDLAAAAARSPKEEGGLNIEGLGETAVGELLLGFRSPVRGGRALVVPIENPAAMVERGERARLGSPRELDLGGRGVRALEWDGRTHWIVAGGPHGREPAARLYRWDGRGPAREVRGVRFGDFNPEGFARVGRRFLVISDDGERTIGGILCKRRKDAATRRFRAAWLRQRRRRRISP